MSEKISLDSSESVIRIYMRLIVIFILYIQGKS